MTNQVKLMRLAHELTIRPTREEFADGKPMTLRDKHGNPFRAQYRAVGKSGLKWVVLTDLNGRELQTCHPGNPDQAYAELTAAF